MPQGNYLGIALFLSVGALILSLTFLNLPFGNPIIMALGAVAGITIILNFIYGGGQIESDIHGSARWAIPRDLKGYLVKSSQPPTPGAFILGGVPEEPNFKDPDLYDDSEIEPIYVSKRMDLPLAEVLRHTLVLGPTGVGKGRGFFLHQLAHFQGSFVYADPKGEGWDHSSKAPTVALRYAPRQPKNTSCFNWIPLCGKDAALCQILALATLANASSGSADNKFWLDTGTAFLSALYAHASTFANPTPASLYKFITTYSADVIMAELKNSPNSIAKNQATLLSAVRDPKLLTGIMIGVTMTLTWLEDSAIAQFTSASLVPPDFTTLRKERTGIYWVLSEEDVALLQPLSSLFFTLCLYQLKQAEGPIPICLFLDEVANIGRIPKLEVDITILRGRKVGLVLGLQSLSQLDKVYGRDAASVIVGNCITKIVLAGLSDLASCEYVSKLLGEKTIVEKQVTRTNSGGIFGREQVSESLAKTRRPLMLPAEVRGISRKQQIIINGNKPGFISARFWYTIPPDPRPAKAVGPALIEAFPLPEEDPDMQEAKTNKIAANQQKGKDNHNKNQTPKFSGGAEAAKQAKHSNTKANSYAMKVAES